MAQTYTAYGLGIRSELPLPELQKGRYGNDVEIRLGTVDKITSEDRSVRHAARISAHEAYLFWQEVGSFGVEEGARITVEPASGADIEGVRLLLLGSVFGVLLHQRGELLLHASSVVVDGQVIAFMGHSGWGKSTMAAAFHAEGYNVVADDITTVRIRPGGAYAIPGYPQIKLRPDSAHAVGRSPGTLPRLHSRLEKHALRFDSGFARESLPIRRIYLLAEGNLPAIENVVPQQALMELVRHSYAAGILKSTGAIASNMRQCAGVVNNVPVRRLRKGASLASLPTLVRMVRNDLATN